jgi:hypothetical protein
MDCSRGAAERKCKEMHRRSWGNPGPYRVRRYDDSNVYRNDQVF